MAKRVFDGTLSLIVNGHTLYGSMQKDKWAFKCNDFRFLESNHWAAKGPAAVVEEFMLTIMREATNE